MEVKEIFNRTGEDVLAASSGEQFPELAIKFFGQAYFLGGPENAPPPVQPSAQSGEFSGTWNSVVTYTQGAAYQDVYTIRAYDDGACDIAIKTKDGQTQPGAGYWSAENGVFKIEAAFPGAPVPRLAAIDRQSVYRLSANGRQLRINVKPAPGFDGVVGVTLNKER